jgi:hypothetical protein
MKGLRRRCTRETLRKTFSMAKVDMNGQMEGYMTAHGRQAKWMVTATFDGRTGELMMGNIWPITSTDREHLLGQTGKSGRDSGRLAKCMELELLNYPMGALELANGLTVNVSAGYLTTISSPLLLILLTSLTCTR